MGESLTWMLFHTIPTGTLLPISLLLQDMIGGALEIKIYNWLH